MDGRAEWPWSWQEEIEWKAELAERDYVFLEELIDDAVEDGMTTSDFVPGPRQDGEPEKDGTQELAAPEKYLVAA
jgi:hypothetical protein